MGRGEARRNLLMERVVSCASGDQRWRTKLHFGRRESLVVFSLSAKDDETDSCFRRRMSLDWTQGDLHEGLRCFHSGAFFEAHEHWESVWLGAQEPERTFCRG